MIKTHAARLMVLFSLVISAFGWSSSASAQVQGPQTFTLDGRIKQAGSTTPLLDASVQVEVHVMDPSRQCVLYAERQTINTLVSNGYFNIQVGSNLGAGKRVAGVDPGHLMTRVFSNSTAMSGTNVSGFTCPAGTYTPTARDQRYFRIFVTPSSTGVTDTLADLYMDAVPMAMVAETAEKIGSFGPSDLLRVNTTAGNELSQANLETVFTTSNRAVLMSLLNGTSTLYNRPASNGTNVLPTIAAPTSPSAGQIWYNAGNIYYHDGTVTRTISTGSSSSVSAGDGTAAAPTISFASDPDTGWYLAGPDTLAASTGGSERVRITSTGRLGIGTTAPAVELDVFGNANVSTQLNIGGIASLYRTGGNLQINNTASAQGVSIFPGSGATTPSIFVENGTGMVGIGTTDPAALFDLTGGDALIHSLTLGRGGGANSKNTAFGLSALAANTTGENNTAIGREALMSNTTMSFMTAVGQGALRSANPTAVSASVAVGSGALYANTTGTSNAALGTFSLISSTTGSYNTGIGHRAAQSATTASNLTAVGYQSLNSLTTGDNNTAIGYQAGQNITTGANNIMIGRVNAISATANDQLNIGNLIFGTGIGTGTTLGTGNVGIGTTAPTVRAHVSGTLRIGDGGELCVAAGAGSLKWNGTAIQFCDGTNWTSLSSSSGTGDFLANGTVPMTAQLRAIAGTTGAPGLTFVGDTNTGISAPAGDTLVFSTGGNEAMRVDTDRAVGIGNTVPMARLRVATESYNGVSIGELPNIAALGTPRGYIGFNLRYDFEDATTSPFRAYDDGSRIGGSIIYSDSYGHMNFSSFYYAGTGMAAVGSSDIASAVSLRIQNNGRIGMGTTAPTVRAHVAGTLRIGDGGELCSAAGAGSLKWNGTAIQFCDGTNWTSLSSASSAGDFKADGSVAMTGQLRTTAGSALAPGMTVTGDTDTGVYFPVADSIAVTTTGTERLRVDSSGNVGIGTTAPGARLQVDQTTAATSGFTSASEFNLIANPSGSASGAFFSPLSTAVNTQAGNAQDIGDLQGANLYASHVGTGTVTHLKGAVASTYSTSSAPVTNSYGLVADSYRDGAASQVIGVDGSASKGASGLAGNIIGVRAVASRTGGTATNVYGVYANGNGYSNASTTNAYGVYALAGQAAQSYGVYIGDSDGASQWGVYQSGATDNNYFAGKVGIGTTAPTVSLDLSSRTDAVSLPRGTTAQRPSSPTNGMIRYNTDTAGVEIYQGGQWANVLTTVSGSGYVPPGTGGTGYFVLTSGVWDGNLGGLTGANTKCRSDLTANNWMNKPGTLDTNKIFAMLCDAGNCQSPLASATFYFAVSGDVAVGGFGFSTDTWGLWADSFPFTSADRFSAYGGSYWVGPRAWPGSNVYSTAPNAALADCSAWSTNSGASNGGMGNGSAIDQTRMYPANTACNAPKRLICFVNP